MKHELKCWPEYFSAIFDGTKTFEVRKDDRGGFAVGDHLLLREYEIGLDLDPHSGTYTGRQMLVEVIYVYAGESWALQHGIVVMGIRMGYELTPMVTP